MSLNQIVSLHQGPFFQAQFAKGKKREFHNNQDLFLLAEKRLKERYNNVSFAEYKNFRLQPKHLAGKLLDRLAFVALPGLTIVLIYRVAVMGFYFLRSLKGENRKFTISKYLVSQEMTIIKSLFFRFVQPTYGSYIAAQAEFEKACLFVANGSKYITHRQPYFRDKISYNSKHGALVDSLATKTTLFDYKMSSIDERKDLFDELKVEEHFAKHCHDESFDSFIGRVDNSLLKLITFEELVLYDYHSVIPMVLLTDDQFLHYDISKINIETSSQIRIARERMLQLQHKVEDSKKNCLGPTFEHLIGMDPEFIKRHFEQIDRKYFNLMTNEQVKNVPLKFLPEKRVAEISNSGRLFKDYSVDDVVEAINKRKVHGSVLGSLPLEQLNKIKFSKLSQEDISFLQENQQPRMPPNAVKLS